MTLQGGEGVCSIHQSAVIWGEGGGFGQIVIRITFIEAEKV